MTTAKVAAVQAAYVLLDQRACLDKTIELLHKAAADGAQIALRTEANGLSRATA